MISMRGRMAMWATLIAVITSATCALTAAYAALIGIENHEKLSAITLAVAKYHGSWWRSICGETCVVKR